MAGCVTGESLGLFVKWAHLPLTIMITVVDEFLHDQLQVGEPTVGLNSKSFKVCGFQLALPIKFRKGEGYSFQPRPQTSPRVAMVILFIVSSDVCCCCFIPIILISLVKKNI